MSFRTSGIKEIPDGSVYFSSLDCASSGLISVVIVFPGNGPMCFPYKTCKKGVICSPIF